MTTQENRLAEIRKAIEAESVSYGELSELQDIAATHPQLFADDPLLAEAAGISEEQWRKTEDTKTRWTVTPYYAPREDADPLGVFRIKEVETEAQKWDDAITDTEPNSQEERDAIDNREGITESARHLIAAAPDLLEALRGSVEWLRTLREENEAAVIESAPDGFSLCDAEAIIAKAEGRAE
jgi:PAS domain-containing protein